MHIYLLSTYIATTMRLIQSVANCLAAEKSSGQTNQEIANKHKVATSYITNLLNHKRSIGGITLATLEKMFPAATVNLTGDIHQEANGNTNSHINQTAGLIAEDRSEVLRGKIILDLIDLGLAPEILARVLTCVKNSKL